MKNIFKSLVFMSLAAGCFVSLPACGEKNPASQNQHTGQTQGNTGVSASLTEADMETLLQSLAQITELERTGSWPQGMALTESGIREQTGDLPGAVAAAYKELSLAYGRGIIQKQDVEQGLTNILGLKSGKSVEDTAVSILAFLRGDWDQAMAGLSAIFCREEDPDSFANWMLLVCALEKNRAPDSGVSGRAQEEIDYIGGYSTVGVYKSIRARYAQYPEYWYRGARAFSGTTAAEYAENCINVSPQGPFADECRRILAEFTGLKSEEGLALRTKREIEVIVSQSVNSGDPQMLDALLPLIGLPDNPYTVYAVGALRVLTNSPKFREYFSVQASASRGRLAERLLYISRS